MISLSPIAIALLWATAAAWVDSAMPFADVRRRFTILLVGSAVASGLAWLIAGGSVPALLTPPMAAMSPMAWGSWQVRWATGDFLGLAPFMISSVGLVSVALSESISHSVGTLRRILLILAVAMLFVATDAMAVLAACWMLSPWIAWRELSAREDCRGVARLFAVYHVPSVLLFCGAALLGGPAAGAWLAAIALVAVGIREAVLPGHSWFVRFVEKAPMGMVVAFVAPQLGVYAQIEWLAHVLPTQFLPIMASFGALTALVAAALGVVQLSTRRALAYLMISQTGLVAFGLVGGGEVALSGALLAWQVLAIATSGLAMTVSALEARRGPLSLATYSGCFSRTPRMAAGFLMMGLGSVGFPLTLGFVAEDLLVQGAAESYPVLAFVLIVATALNGMNVMRCFFHLFSGRAEHAGERDLTNREAWALSAVLLGLLMGGLAPHAITSREFMRALEHPTVERTGPDGSAVAVIDRGGNR